jgi:hypothetical protein
VSVLLYVISTLSLKGYKVYKDGLQPETLADGNWLVKQNQPVSKIETKSDTLRLGWWNLGVQSV